MGVRGAGQGICHRPRTVQTPHMLLRLLTMINMNSKSQIYILNKVEPKESFQQKRRDIWLCAS